MYESMCIVEYQYDAPVEESVLTGDGTAQRALVTRLFDALPAYGSGAFWLSIEEPELVLPLEVLVRCIRSAITRDDERGRNRILEVIFRRIQTSNIIWASTILKSMYLPPDECQSLINDLYADLCECIMRALMDGERLFWEENFQHCLRFERRHVYRAFMTREGRWEYGQGKRAARIPRKLVKSMDRSLQQADGELQEEYIEDEKAQRALLAVEYHELPFLINKLPGKLKPVILLIFWEGKTEKDAARVLGISDRTVRNRLKNAFKILQQELEPERTYLHG